MGRWDELSVEQAFVGHGQLLDPLLQYVDPLPLSLQFRS